MHSCFKPLKMVFLCTKLIQDKITFQSMATFVQHLHCSAQNSNCLLCEALCVHKSLSEMSWTNSLIQSSVQNRPFLPVQPQMMDLAQSK